jgi:hypothetical protein
VYKVLVGNPEGERSLGRSRRAVEGRMESEWILGRLAGGWWWWSGFNWLRIRAFVF